MGNSDRTILWSIIGVACMVAITTTVITTARVRNAENAEVSESQPRRSSRRLRKRADAFSEPYDETYEEKPVPVPPRRKVPSISKYFRVKPDLPPPLITILPNAGNGDCLFHCFRRALKSLGKSFSILDLRAIVASAATEDQLDTLKLVYSGAEQENDIEILNDYSFMKGVETLGDLRVGMMKRSYWGDEMALTALEKETGLKAVVFTTLHGKMEIAKQLGDSVPPASGRYIMLRLHANHYQLIKYDKRVTMRFSKLPAEVQTGMAK